MCHTLRLTVFPPSLSLQYNFVGRILGPRGLTAKQLEAETGCKIMVRGKSSMRDKKKVSPSTPNLCPDLYHVRNHVPCANVFNVP